LFYVGSHIYAVSSLGLFKGQGRSRHKAEEAVASADLVRAPTTLHRRRRMLPFWEHDTNTLLTEQEYLYLFYPKS